MNYDYDVVIIGAGIHGAGAAQAAAAAGYSALVIEQYATPAQGTSSKSSKLIHGGLRYLETAQLQLVYECLHERKNLLNNAPHLVKLLPFYIPIYKNTTRRPWKIFAGLSLYSLLSRKKFSRIPRNNWDQLDGLTTKNLDAVFSYFDAQTDDSKLTRAVLSSAQSLGADVSMDTTFESAQVFDNRIEIDFSKSNKKSKVTAHALINAAGPWVNNVLEKISPTPQKMAIKHVQGTHIVIPGKVKQPFYLEAPQDKRAVFVMPYGKNTSNQILIGTTENDYQGNPEKVKPLETEINYLLEIYNFYFNTNIKQIDIIKSFSGLRVLPAGTGSAFTKSRDTFIKTNNANNPRVISIYGGKLTSFRATSEKLIKQLKSILPKRQCIANTKALKLPLTDNFDI